jgi:hypothetical protein
MSHDKASHKDAVLEAPAESRHLKQAFTGLMMIALAGLAVILAKVFEDHVKLGRLIGIVIAFGGLGALFLGVGLTRLAVLMFRQERYKALMGILLISLVVLLSAVMLPRLWNGKTPSGDEFVPLVGKSWDSSEVQKVVAQLGSGYRQTKSGKNDVFEWERHHLEIHVDPDQRIHEIVFGGIGVLEEYRGVLPYGLVLADSRDDVLTKFEGEPQREYGTDLIFPEKGLSIDFSGNSIRIVKLTTPIPPKSIAGKESGR